jgi:hypothetical protein
MLEIAGKFGAKNRNANEDVFFVTHAERMHMSLPTRRTAYEFAVEIPCHDVNLTIAIAHHHEISNGETAAVGLVRAPAAGATRRSPSPARVAGADNVLLGRKNNTYFTPLALHSTWAYIDSKLTRKLLELSVLPKYQ